MRALLVSNMAPSPERPERGAFVRDQAQALRALGGVEVELFEFPPGAGALLRAAARLRARYRQPFDVVHAHYGLTAWPALAVPARLRALTLHGSELAYRRTLLLTRLALPLIDLPAAASPDLAAAAPPARRPYAVLPCGVNLARFKPLPRAQARDQLGLSPKKPLLLFPGDPRRPEKRYDRAAALARSLGVPLLALGGVRPELVPVYLNAADLVLVPSEREGFGLATLEALACNVAVLATPVGIHPEILKGLPGTLCAPFSLARWRAAAASYLGEGAPPIPGRERAARYSTERMAEAVVGAWQAALTNRNSGGPRAR